MILTRMRNKVDNGWNEGDTLDNDEMPGVPLLSPEQVAYCPFQSCVNHLSTLLGIITRREARGLPTFICLTDLKKFFDRACRCNIFTHMYNRGFWDKAICTIYKIFTKTQNTIQIGPGAFTRSFESTTGVWQGSSPSTMLATIVLEPFIEKLNKEFEKETDAPTLADGTKIHCLGFCDDLITIAGSMESLNKKVQTFLKWCPEAGVCPHDSDTGKSNIMIFGPYEVDGSERIQANSKGLLRILHREGTYTVILATMYKYLGWVLESDMKGNEQLAKLEKATHAFIARM